MYIWHGLADNIGVGWKLCATTNNPGGAYGSFWATNTYINSYYTENLIVGSTTSVPQSGWNALGCGGSGYYQSPELSYAYVNNQWILAPGGNGWLYADPGTYSAQNW
jgi:hypothetical protein